MRGYISVSINPQFVSTLVYLYFIQRSPRAYFAQNRHVIIAYEGLQN